MALTRRVGPLPPPRSAVLSESAGEFRRWIAFNDLGFRGPATQFKPDAGRRPRLLVTGDSYTSAWQVALEERFTERLEGLEPRWSVLNLGMPNWGTDQQYLLLVSYPLARAADLILLFLTPLNDIADNGRALLVGPPNRPHFVPASPHAGEAFLREIAWTYRNPFEDMGPYPFPLNLRTWLSLHSVVYRGARDLRGVLAQAWAKPSASPSCPPDPATIPIEYGSSAVDRTDPRWRRPGRSPTTSLLSWGMRPERKAPSCGSSWCPTTPRSSPSGPPLRGRSSVTLRPDAGSLPRHVHRPGEGGSSVGSHASLRPVSPG